MLQANFERVLDDPGDLESRGAMLLGANFAGSAIENSMLGATHACANPLTAHLGLTHGVAIGIMLPHVIRYNTPVVGDAYAELTGVANLSMRDKESAGERLATRVQELVAKSGQPQCLTQCGLAPQLIPVLAEEAMQQWTGKFNPRPLEHRDFVEIYKCAL
jgi:alcohol dehydrogenase